MPTFMHNAQKKVDLCNVHKLHMCKLAILLVLLLCKVHKNVMKNLQKFCYFDD